MLKLMDVRWKNLLSTGNEWTGVSLDHPGTTLVVGRNGAGKSTLLDAVVYALYGKPYRKVRNGQMLNSITGRELVVELRFEARGTTYLVRRGQKPALFEVHRDGALVDQADSNRDQQDWLERAVLQMDQRSFTQIVILGSANHVPFMQLPAAQRRQVIEDVLDIQVFSAMNDVLKERASGMKEELTGRQRDLAVLSRELEVEERHLEQVQRDNREESTSQNERLVEATDRADRLGSQAAELSRTSAELAATISDSPAVEARIEQVQRAEERIMFSRRTASEERRFYEHNANCPTCKQGLDPVFVRRAIAEKTGLVERADENLATARKASEKVLARMDEIRGVRARIQANDQEFVRLGAERREAVREAEEASRRMRELGNAARDNTSLVEELRSRVEEASSLVDETMGEARVMAAASGMLRDGGIKARIVAQYVPLMNRLVNRYLASLDLFVDFHLDESFNEEIRSRHRDSFSYENFSEGEKLRIDLAILFAWRDIARMRNSSAVSAIVFDEVLDGSLDAEGADHFLRLVASLTDGASVTVISHREGLEDKFGRVLSFTKTNNFSRLSSSTG